MSSEYEHASPDKKVFMVQMNDPYATLITKLVEGMIGIANDRNAMVIVDKDGNQYKTLMDSSGDGIIPENCIAFVDDSGLVTYNSNFKFDSTNARIQFPLPFTLAFGDQETNGSIRIRIATTGIYFGHRTAGVWEEAPLLI